MKTNLKSLVSKKLAFCFFLLEFVFGGFFCWLGWFFVFGTAFFFKRLGEAPEAGVEEWRNKRSDGIGRGGGVWKSYFHSIFPIFFPYVIMILKKTVLLFIISRFTWMKYFSNTQSNWKCGNIRDVNAGAT